MWWLIVGIILIVIWAYYTFFNKHAVTNEESVGKPKQTDGIPDGVNVVTGWHKSGRIDHETDIFEADTRRKQAQQQSIVADTGIKQAKIDQDELDEITRRKKELDEAAHLKEVARLEAERIREEEAKQAAEIRMQLAQLAIKEGQDLGTYQEIQRKTELDRLELEKQWQEAQHKLKAGFIYQLQAHQHLSLMTEYIGGLYDRARKLEEEGKDRELKLIEEHIAFMEGDFRERQRLLQAANQQELRGSDSDTQLGGEGGTAMGTKSEQLSPVNRGPGRPKGSKNKSGGA
ncbi:MAG TPA: hypothetical protein VJS44_12990 [Pyrinomonadaceae bacterium]|nr:hypothetical protein [Pyrinomonadaceae bacterium]